MIFAIMPIPTGTNVDTGKGASTESAAGAFAQLLASEQPVATSIPAADVAGPATVGIVENEAQQPWDFDGAAGESALDAESSSEEALPGPILEPLATSASATLTSWLGSRTLGPAADRQPTSTDRTPVPTTDQPATGGAPREARHLQIAGSGLATSAQIEPHAEAVGIQGEMTASATAMASAVASVSSSSAAATPMATSVMAAVSNTTSDIETGHDTPAPVDAATDTPGTEEAGDTHAEPAALVIEQGTPSDIENAGIDHSATLDGDVGATSAAQSADAETAGQPEPIGRPADDLVRTDALDSPDVIDIRESQSTQTEVARPAGRPTIDASMMRRVEAALDQLEHAPPPRTLVLDLDEEAGIRIRLSSDGDGVNVDIESGQGRQHDREWEQDLRRSLAERGFDLGGEQRPRQDSPDDGDDTPVRQARRSSDEALRI